MDPNYVTASVVGDIQFCNGRSIIDEIFEYNPMMNDLDPGEKRDILEGLRVISEAGSYLIDGSHRLECGRCAEICPEDAIKPAEGL